MLSDLGVMFLMFSIGLGFSFRRVRQMGGAVVFPAIWDVILITLGGFMVGKILGWTNLECFLLGLILCDSSTSIAAKTLESMGWLGKRFADCTFAIALIEDVLAILLIAVLNGVSGGTAGSESTSWVDTAIFIGKQLGVLALFLIGVVAIGIQVAPRIMNYVTDRFDDEIVLMVALGICFGVACLAQNGLDLSLVVGAFLAGTIIAEARARRRIERAVKPITNLFAAVFFVSVGLAVNPVVLWQNLGTVIFIAVAMIIFKFINNASACLLVNEEPRDAFKVGIGMGQVAEFSFIIAGIGMDNGMSDRPLYQIAVGIALISTATSPYLLKNSDKIYDLCSRLTGPKTHDMLHWYRRWFTSLHTNNDAGGKSVAAHLRGHLLWMMLDLAFILIFFIGVYVLAHLPYISDFLTKLDSWQPIPYTIPWSGLLQACAALVVSSGAFWAAQHTWSEFSRHVAEDAFTGTGRQLNRVRRFIRSSLRIFGLTFLAFYALVLCSGFVHSIWILALLLLSAVLFIMRFSKTFRKGCEESRNTLLRAFDVDELPPEDPATMESVIAVHTETLVIPHNAEVHGKALGELNLRGETGAAVISVSSRGKAPNVSPGRDTRLYSGDAVILVGSDEELAKATEFLSRRFAK